MTPEERTLLLVTAQCLRNHIARIGGDVTGLDAAAHALIHEDGDDLSHTTVMAGAKVLRARYNELYHEADEIVFQAVAIAVFKAMKEP